MGDWYYINCCMGKCVVREYNTPESAVLSKIGDDMWTCSRYCTNRHDVVHKNDYVPGTTKAHKPAGIEAWDRKFRDFVKRYASEYRLKGDWGKAWGDYHWQACQAMAVDMFGERPSNATAYDIIDRG